MATNTTTGSGNWSDTSKWDLGHVPTAGEDVIVATGHVMADDVARIPATSGVLNSLTFQTTGQVTVDLAARSDGDSIHSTTITGGSVLGAIKTSGSGSGKTFHVHATTAQTGTSYLFWPAHSAGTLAIHATTFTGGSGTGTAAGIFTGTGTFTIDGVVEGVAGRCALVGGNASGSGASPGIYLFNTGTGPVLTGVDVKGGSSACSPGISNLAVAGNTIVPTLTDCTLQDSANCVAYMGVPPTWTPAATDYHKLADGTRLAPEVAAGNIRDGVTNGLVTGTLELPSQDDVTINIQYGEDGTEYTGNHTDPNTDGSTPDASLVKSTAHFGINNGTQGTLNMGLYTLSSTINWPTASQTLLTGTPYWGITGSLYDGNVTLPADGTKVLTSQAAFGVGGISITPSATLTAGANVVTGSGLFGIDGDSETPSYPTTAASKAAQLLDDQATVYGLTEWIIYGHSILGQAGTFPIADYTLTSGIVWPAAANVSTVEAAWGPTGAEYAGLLDLGLYTLTSGIVWPAEANVSTVETDFGPTGAEYHGALNLGLYTLTSGMVWPAAANVSTVETAWGPTGAEYAGALDLGLYTLTSGIVWPAEGNVSTVEAAWGPTGAEYAGSLDLALYTLTSTINWPTQAQTLLTGTPYWGITGALYDGTFDEAARNVDPGVANVLRPADGGPTNYRILNAVLVGTLASGGGGTEVWTFEDE